jgi:glycosyltransferase involved in cell wall biosynthesis
VGGQSVQADLFMRYWKGDPDVEAIFVPIDPPLPSWAAWAKGIRGLRTLFREPVYFAGLWRSLSSVDVAHIFASSYWSFSIAAAPAWFIGKIRGRKTLLNYRSGDARDHLTRFRSAALVMGSVDEVVVPTPYLVDVLNEFGINAITIPNVADLSQFHYRARDQVLPRLICPRGFSAYYCVDIVLRAFAQIQQIYPEATLALLGKGPLEDQVRDLAAGLSLTGVTFCGAVSRQRIGEYYDHADIFINASCVDAMPVSVIEAFRAGTPVVTTSPEAMSYLVEHERTGLLSPVGDAESLAANVIRLIRSPRLASHIAEGAFQESHKYEWSSVRNKWLTQYRRLADSVTTISTAGT